MFSATECFFAAFFNPSIFRLLDTPLFLVLLILVVISWGFGLRSISNLRALIISTVVALFFIIGFAALFTYGSCRSI